MRNSTLTAPPPRLSDLYGAERMAALQARAAADRERYLQMRSRPRLGVGLLSRWVDRVRG